MSLHDVLGCSGEEPRGIRNVLGHALHVHEFGNEELVRRARQLGFFAALDILLGPECVLVIEMQYEFRYTGQNHSAKNAVMRNRAVGHN